MSYLIEFQRQQKALRDAERDRKKNASSMLNKYRGGEDDVKEQMRLKALKDADRDNKKNAASMLNQYRGGEHDVKEQMKLKALKDADRDNKKKASSDLHKYQSGEHDVKEQMKLKALKDADRDNKKKASSNLHSYRGGEHDVKEYERAVIQEKSRGKSEHLRSSFVASPSAGPKPVVSNVSTDLEKLKIDIENKEEAPKVSPKAVSKGNALGKYEQSLSNNPTTDTKSTSRDPANARKPLSIDFSFGIILLDDEPFPDVEFCEAAASVIIPHAISQWTNETNIFCNPKTPKITGEIDTDDWYEADDSIRYKVKGTIPVQVFSESSEKEVEEGLKKVLKRRVSFRPYDSELGPVSAQTIIGDGDKKWIRVRDGMIGGLGIQF